MKTVANGRTKGDISSKMDEKTCQMNEQYETTVPNQQTEPQVDKQNRRKQ
jgi:hypothetical protein